MLDRKGRVDGVGSKETTYFPNVGVKVNFMFPRHVNSIHTQNCPTKSHASSDFRIMERIKEGKKEIGSSHKGFLKRTITREAREGHVDMNGKFLTPLHIH